MAQKLGYLHSASTPSQMKVVWSYESLEDLERIYEFHADFSVPVARKVVAMIRRATKLPTVFPQVGRACARYAPRDVRDLFVGDFQLRYEVEGKTIRVVRVWHSKEDR